MTRLLQRELQQKLYTQIIKYNIKVQLGVLMNTNIYEMKAYKIAYMMKL